VKKKANPKRVRKRKPPPRARGERPLHEQLGISRETEIQHATRIGHKVSRLWWKTRDLSAVLDTVSLSQALRDLGMISVKVLLAELTNPACPIEIRRHIAMTMAPKLAVEVRAAVAQQVAEQQQQSPVLPGQQTIDLSDLLADLDRRGEPILMPPGHA